MTERNSNSNFRLIFLLAVLLLLCGGVQSALACLLPGNQSYNYEIRVDSCHLVVEQQELPPCCQFEVCHQATPQKHDLGSPGYHNQLKDSHSLAHESRSLIPQLKAGTPFLTKYIFLPQFASLARISQTPLQSLHSLRTVVLLN